jgi:hypothetical protein
MFAGSGEIEGDRGKIAVLPGHPRASPISVIIPGTDEKPHRGVIGNVGRKEKRNTSTVPAG